MSQSTLTRELALRIGLAARALPDTDPKLFVTVLSECARLPFTEQSLAEINSARLAEAFSHHGISFDTSAISQSLQILQTPPALNEEEQPVDLPASVRIAIGNNGLQRIDGHFGSCPQFSIYQVAVGDVRRLGTRLVDPEQEQRYADKNAYRAELIGDCQVLYIASIGGPAAAKVVRQGIHPIKADSGEPIAQVIGQLQAVLARTPPPWLAKVMGIAPQNRIYFEQETSL